MSSNDFFCSTSSPKPNNSSRTAQQQLLDRLIAAALVPLRTFIWFPQHFLKKVFFPHLQLAAAQLFAHFQPCVHGPLQVPLQPPAEVPEHGGASGEHDVLKHKEEVHVDQNRLTVTLTGAAEVLPCGSVPCTADVWHRWGSSGWLRPPPPRWAGWSLGWRTGRE